MKNVRRGYSLSLDVVILVCLGVLGMAAQAAEPDRLVPVVVHATAPDSAVWRTVLVAHNPSEGASRLEMTFRPLGARASADDPKSSLVLAAGESVTIGDLLGERFGLSQALGGLDIEDAQGEPALLDLSVTRDSCGGGVYTMPIPVLTPASALRSGERAVLLVPAAPNTGMNVGLRVLGAAPSVVDVRVRDSRGATRGSVSRTFDAGAFLSAADFARLAVQGGDSIVVDVASGTLVLYGAPFDTRSGDTSYQPALRVAAAGFPTSDFTPPTGRDGNALEGPGVSRLMTATSLDGLSFTRTGLIVTDQGDVPDLVTDARGWVYLYYVGWTVGTERNKPVVAISRDAGRTWVYKKLVLTGFEGMRDPVDPDVQVLPDGTFRMYLTSAEANDLERAKTYFAEGTDGIHFTKMGVAFAPATGVSLDPSTVKIGSTWRMFSGGTPGSNHHATSADGRVFTFDREMTFLRNGIGQLMANGIPVPGGTRFYTFDSTPPVGGQRGINSVFTADGVTWTVDAGQRLSPDPASTKENNGLKDPAAVRLSDGTYLMVYSTRVP